MSTVEVELINVFHADLFNNILFLLEISRKRAISY